MELKIEMMWQFIIDLFSELWYPLLLFIIVSAFFLINLIMLLSAESVVGETLAISLFGGISYGIYTLKDIEIGLLEQLLSYGIIFVFNVALTLWIYKKNEYSDC